MNDVLNRAGFLELGIVVRFEADVGDRPFERFVFFLGHFRVQFLARFHRQVAS